jgi:hypothetical protein
MSKTAQLSENVSENGQFSGISTPFSDPGKPLNTNKNSHLHAVV